MTAYYNENDPFAAAWLRELIKENLIAPGEVDERSIEEVKPDDLRGFTQCHFFAGIGVWSYALRNAGWPDDSPVWSGSCPCQGFSASGQRGGFSDKRHLWPAWFRLIRECAPHAIFGEQVSSKDGLAWFDVVSADLENEGYAIGAIDTCAAGVGAPHVRQRMYFVAHASDIRRAQHEHESRQRGTKSPLDGTECEGLGTVADSEHAERRQSTARGNNGNGQEARRQQGSGLLREYGEAGDVAHTELSGLGGRRSSEAGPQPGTLERPERLRSISGMVDTEINRSGALDREHGPGGQPQVSTRGSSDAERVANARESECGGRAQSERDEQRRILHSPDGGSSFWRDAEWIYCKDGKYRPTKPGLFPLAHGITGRVGLLRGAGNALCAPQAKAFIEAYLDIVEKGT
jgi:DNA (cytosine-5)-methyltransferase 1